MIISKNPFSKISVWSKQPRSSTPAEETEYAFQIQTGMKTRIKRVLNTSAAIESRAHQVIVPTLKGLDSTWDIDADAEHTSGVVREPFQCRTCGAGEREQFDAVASKVIDFAHVKVNPKGSFDAIPATDGNLTTQGKKMTATVNPDDQPTTPRLSEQTNRQDCSHDENKNDAIEETLHKNIAKPRVRAPTTERNTHSKLDPEIPSSWDDTRTDRFTASGESSSRLTSWGSRSPTEITNCSLYLTVAPPEKDLALIPYKPVQWRTGPSSGRHAVPDAGRARDADLNTSEPFCNGEEKHAAELEGLRESLKEEYEIDLEIRIEKLQDKHNEKIRELQSELDHTASSRDYVKLLGKKKLDHALDAKIKLEQTLHDVEGIVKVKDAVIEAAEANAAQLKEKLCALEEEREKRTEDHSAVLSELQIAINTYVEEKEAHIQGLVNQLNDVRASRPNVDVHNTSATELVEHLACRPMDAAMAYLNVRKELTLAEKHTIDLQNQLNNFNDEFDQEPARLAGVTRLLEFKDGHILELQKAGRGYHEALEQSRATSLRNQEHSKADIKLRKAEVELLQKEKADLQMRLEETRQGWENVAQMFGRQVFADDIANSMNELYEVVKQDNSFLCSTIEANGSQIAHSMRKEKHLKMKILDLEKVTEQFKGAHEQYEEDVRAAKYATESASIEMNICVDSLNKQIESRDATITMLNKNLKTLRDIVDVSVNPIRGSAALMKQKDAEIASLAQELEVTSSRKLELEHLFECYEDLQSWKKSFDRREDQQEFAIRSLGEKVVQLEESLRVALVASDSAKLEAAQSIIQQLGEMAEAWRSMRTECDRFKREAGHAKDMLQNERVYFVASIGAAREVLMVVWKRYQKLWYGLHNEGIVPEEDQIGPQEISDQVAQIFQNDDAQQAGINAIVERYETAATADMMCALSMQQPEAEDRSYEDQLIDAAKIFLEQQTTSTEEPAELDRHSVPLVGDDVDVPPGTLIGGIVVKQSPKTNVDVTDQTDLGYADLRSRENIIDSELDNLKGTSCCEEDLGLGRTGR
ncbi:MAG: hypothetical protein Q9186_006204 [Xanthomendoza sp. 1 TL-2023]